MKWFLVIFVALYIAALFLFLVGTFGWFGSEPGPLAGIFLLPLGLPWNLLADALGFEGPVPVVAAPLLNVAFFYRLWQRRAQR